MIKELTEQLSHGNNLSINQMTSVMDEILTGTQTDEDIAEFLKNLTENGESDDELLAMLNKMEEYSLHISPNCKGKLLMYVALVAISSKHSTSQQLHHL